MEKNLMRLALLKMASGDVEKARNMAAFVEETEPRETPPAGIGDGIYLVLDDGKYVPFRNRDNTEDEMASCTGIGVKMGDKSLVVSVCEIPDVELTTDNERSEAEYKTDREDAVSDWNGAGNTAKLHLNPEIHSHLDKGEYVPSLGEMLFILLFKKQINEALRWVGADELRNDWYWTSTEFSPSNAWYLNLSNGSMNGNTKAVNRLRVRPVSAFIHQ